MWWQVSEGSLKVVTQYGSLVGKCWENNICCKTVMCSFLNLHVNLCAQNPFLFSVYAPFFPCLFCLFFLRNIWHHFLFCICLWLNCEGHTFPLCTIIICTIWSRCLSTRVSDQSHWVFSSETKSHLVFCRPAHFHWKYSTWRGRNPRQVLVVRLFISSKLLISIHNCIDHFRCLVSLHLSKSLIDCGCIWERPVNRYIVHTQCMQTHMNSPELTRINQIFLFFFFYGPQDTTEI